MIFGDARRLILDHFRTFHAIAGTFKASREILRSTGGRRRDEFATTAAKGIDRGSGRLRGFRRQRRRNRRRKASPTGGLVMEKTEDKVKDALGHIRAAAQDLHGAISDATAKRGGAIKADFETVSQKAKAVAESIKGCAGVQDEAAKKRLAEAVTHLEATQKDAAEALKSSGQAFQNAVRQTLADARASVQKVSEAVAAVRSAEFTQPHK